jgi:hypothetical protein
MNISHPSETELQQYAVDKSSVPASVGEHLISCKHCHDAVAGYQLLFAEINRQPKPVFDFDLPGLVLDRLAVPKTGLSPDRFIAGFLFVFISCCVGIPVWFFRIYLVNMFAGVSPFFIYAISISGILILSFNLLKTYKKYRRQIRLLNFH